MKHVWVAMSYTPIEVELLEDGTLHTFTTELGDEVAREQSLLGCFHCIIPLATETFDTECLGKIENDGTLTSWGN